MKLPLIQQLKQQFVGKTVLVVGLGLQGGGVGLVRFFSQLGAKVTVTDLKSKAQLASSISKLQSYTIKYNLGGHKLDDFLSADYIFKGPSVPWNLPELLATEKENIPIEMEASFFASLIPNMLIGVTGTRGKTTTSEMIYESLKSTTKSVYLAGNIAQFSTIELLNKIHEDDIVVLELSSWQLSGFHRKKISPHIAVFTNFYPDHLNYYKNVEEYFYDKSAIYAYQQKNDYLIANSYLQNRLEKRAINSAIKYFSAKDFPKKLTYLRGEHNYENAAAALLVNQVLEKDAERAAELIANFKGTPYRQEIVKQGNHIYFINDSTSTTPTSIIKALETFNDGKIVLILGGNSKQLPFSNLIDKLKLADYIVLLKGSFTDEILPYLKEKYSQKISVVYDDLTPAVKFAFNKANALNQKTYILFSPGATSFAMFSNEFERAKDFNKIVETL